MLFHVILVCQVIADDFSKNALYLIIRDLSSKLLNMDDFVQKHNVSGCPGITRDNKGSPKIVVGVSGTRSIDAILRGYDETRTCPHFTIDLDTESVYQHVDLTMACHVYPISDIISPHRRSESYWVFINRNSGDPLTEDENRFMMEFISSLADEVGVANNVYPVPMSLTEVHSQALGIGHWESYSGVMTAAVVPGSRWKTLWEFDADSLYEIRNSSTQNQNVEMPSEEEVIEKTKEDELSYTLGEWKGRSLSPGSTGKKIAMLREMFALEDGNVYDDDLFAIVTEAQAFVGMEEPDGIIDRDTWQALEELLLSKEFEAYTNNDDSEIGDINE